MRALYVKLSVVAASVALTLAIHYGWILEHVFGHSGWVHALHGRFCYIPIVVAASWFGLRGGVITAAAISLLVVPYLVSGSYHGELSGELVEIVFYFAIAVLAGGLVDREFALRRRQQETQRQLERSHQLSIIGRMAAGVAHEIKNPLASIKGAVEILTGESASRQDKEEFGRIIGSEVRRIDGTISEFLAFGRPKQARLERTDLTETLKTTIRQFENQAASAGVRLRSDVADGIVVTADREKIHQVVLNLLLNALEASGQGSNIEIGLVREGAKSARLSVTDFGRGISEEDQGRIFEPFYTTKSSGSGLGLAVARSIVESHNGSISVTSEPSSGTEFVVRLPLLRE
ncbi:MAG TPA: ATP-binding protein [Acidobacteriota bacterium]|nr:ATP-binding protein [Acidobacteriota bacterium]